MSSKLQLLFAGTYDNLDNAWAVPTTVLHGSGTGVVATTGGFYSGPRGCVITDIYYLARDLTFTDPAGEVHIGWRVRTSVDGGATLVTQATVWATNDCPRIWDDTANDSADFSLDQPIRAHAWYAAGAGGLEDNFFGDLVILANAHVTVEVAPVLDQALVNMPAADLDSFDVLVYGFLKG
ncbi:hypothetical protein LCGC14_0825850 [marine sediment metagenome]|uniref:Uncharacterized protein n=1 Tax=marine sediment metagenome TaxID=412755 RepID=A0A0F9S264_9ZZZZ